MNQVMYLKILDGRKVVDAYREAHRQLHSKPWYKGIPKEHTPLLNSLLAELENKGFSSLQEFWDASEELNIQELGFESRADFEARATKSDSEALERMWQ